MTAIFGGAWSLLRANWIIVLPSLVVGLLSAVAANALSAAGVLSWTFFANMNAQGPDAFVMYAATIAAIGLRILGALVAIALTTGMAGAAWERGTARLGDGFAALRWHGLQALFALLILFALGLCAAALLVPTFTLSVFAYMVFALYTMPAVLLGGRSAPEAIVESIGLAARNLGVTACIVVLIVLLAVGGALAGKAALHLPLLGETIAWIVQEVVVAYATLVVVGEYRKCSLGTASG